MNKKFSTLAVAAMLASAFTAYAGPGDVVTKLAVGNNGKQYQLRAILPADANDQDAGYLTLDQHDGALEITETPELIGESLWCVDVTRYEQGQNPIFDFTNKAYGSVLEVTVGGLNTNDWEKKSIGSISYSVDKSQAVVGGEVRGWEFVPVLSGMFGASAGQDADDFATTAVGNYSDAKIYSLNSYISSTQVATLIWDQAANKGNGAIKVAVVNAADVNKLDNRIKFFLQEAYPVDLTADQFNSILNTQDKDKGTVKLTFNPKENNTEVVNPFSIYEFRASNAKISDDLKCSNPVDCPLAEDHKFVYLYKTEADGTENYLRVDTAYANGFGTKFLTFGFESKFGKNKNSVDPAKEQIIPNQYKFRLNYCPTDDSLSIQVMTALYKLKDDGGSWSNLAKEENAVAEGKLPKPVKNEDYVVTKWTDSKYENNTPNHPSGLTWHQTNWVKLQDLELATESRIITIGDAPINTHISFGYGNCANVASEYTSVDDGVYYIKNAKGQYLTYPIYKEEPQFVTVNADEQEVAHMPAFQWVVLKKYTTTSEAKATSPVLIANREYNTKVVFKRGNQLMKAEGAEYMYISGNQLKDQNEAVAVDSLLFVDVPQASIEDPYLGYKKITKEELMANKYTFNYWHPYAQDKYIAQAENDSTFTVWNEIDAFNIDTVAYNPEKHNALIAVVDEGKYEFKYMSNVVDKSTVDITYGFNPENAKLNDKERIEGLAHLVRTAYKVSLNGADWRVNENDQFNVGKSNAAYGQDAGDIQKYDEYIAFFKENMHVNGLHYYAVIKAENGLVPLKGASYDEEKGKMTNLKYNVQSSLYSKKSGVYTNAEFDIVDQKAGVSDYDGAATLKSQPLDETRTSSFAIEPDDTPLYRRFNSTLEGQAGDAQDTLRFYEKYRSEYLMIEANKNFTVEHIDFLGIEDADMVDSENHGGLAFIVDTAWVNRGFGNLKPQYLISIDRHDKAGTPGVPCTYEHNHFDNKGNAVDAAHCSHATPATPGFARGKYLINFQRFANNEDMVKADDYKWAGYTRAGFKEAVVVEDTLYVLRDEFKNLPNEEITVEKLASAEVEALSAWTKAGKDAKDFLSYKYVLSGDEHKYATWSMRFVDRENAANEVEADRAFLFESMNASLNADEAQWIAPTQAAWLKMQNGCLVLSDPNESKFNEVVTGGDDALIFNVEHVCDDQLAVDNEEIAVEGVSVVAGNGQVTIMGAAGKNVTITNILGKVIASQVIASDNATIAVPAGIVAVAVEGEAAVKAIVK